MLNFQLNRSLTIRSTISDEVTSSWKVLQQKKRVKFITSIIAHNPIYRTEFRTTSLCGCTRKKNNGSEHHYGCLEIQTSGCIRYNDGYIDVMD